MYKLGYAYALAGRVTEAIALILASLDRIAGSRGGHALATAWLGEAYLLSGQIDDALRRASEALDLARRRGEATMKATELGMRPLAAHWHLGLGKLYWRTGKRDEAREHLATATTMYREMGMTY